MKTKRREFIQKIGAGVAGLGFAAPLSLVAAPESNTTLEVNNQIAAGAEEKPVLYIGDNIAVTNTTYGKVRGFIMKDIYTYLGIPYGADTSGKNRFMPPQKPAAWND